MESNEKQEIKYAYSILLLGDLSVGKTCLIERIIGKPFPNTHITTIGIELVRKRVERNNHYYLLSYIDTNGGEHFKHLSPPYIKKTHCVLFVFSFDNRSSFSNLPIWID